MLAAAVITLRPDISVIIGVWGGRDTLAMGLAHREIGKGKVIGIDPWDASASIQDQNEANTKWWGTISHEAAYVDFLDKRAQLDLVEIIAVERMISDYFTPPAKIGLLVIDGNHGPQSIRDVERYAPSVPIGGLCMMDDVHWEGGYVRNATGVLMKMGFEALYKIDESVMFQRVK